MRLKGDGDEERIKEAVEDGEETRQKLKNKEERMNVTAKDGKEGIKKLTDDSEEMIDRLRKRTLEDDRD
jgi:hypothetical protein